MFCAEVLRRAYAAAYRATVRQDARRIDTGVRDVVTLLNRIPGVRTRSSCEGTGLPVARHTHAAHAYVVFRHPLPLQFRDFLVIHLGQLARIDDDGIYCRWPRKNRTFIGSLESAARLYLRDSGGDNSHTVRWPLARLRAHLARQVARGGAAEIRLCFTCKQLIADPHPATHQLTTLLDLPQGLPNLWFAEFSAQPANTLDPVLIAAAGWADLLTRTQRGDFGEAFRRRWLRYRGQQIAHLATRRLRAGVDAARRKMLPIDFFHDGTHAVFMWAKVHPAGACRDA